MVGDFFVFFFAVGSWQGSEIHSISDPRHCWRFGRSFMTAMEKSTSEPVGTESSQTVLLCERAIDHASNDAPASEKDSPHKNKLLQHHQSKKMSDASVTENFSSSPLRRRTPEKGSPKRQSMTSSYTEVPTSETAITMGTDNNNDLEQPQGQEGDFPSSFPKRSHAGLKTLFPWLRSYMFRRRLSFAMIGAVFVIVGASATFVLMKTHGEFL